MFVTTRTPMVIWTGDTGGLSLYLGTGDNSPSTRRRLSPSRHVLSLVDATATGHLSNSGHSLAGQSGRWWPILPVEIIYNQIIDRYKAELHSLGLRVKRALIQKISFNIFQVLVRNCIQFTYKYFSPNGNNSFRFKLPQKFLIFDLVGKAEIAVLILALRVSLQCRKK